MEQPINKQNSMQVEENRKGSNRNLYLSSCAVLVGSICAGLVLGMSSPLIPAIQNDTSANALTVSEKEAAWIGSILQLGAIPGGIVGGLMIQSLGRKRTAVLSGLPYVAGFMLISFATNVWMIYAGRFVNGCSLATTTLLVATYISEISTKSLRGLLCSGGQLGITVGVFIIFAFGGIFTWRWMSFVVASFPVFMSIFCLFIPESPRYLLLKNTPKKAAKTLQMLRGEMADISGELCELKEAIELNSESSWKEIFLTPSLRIPFLLSLTLMFLQQTSGINCVTFFLGSIFQSAGFTTKMELLLPQLLMSGTQVIFTTISSCFMDRLGRKLLLSLSGSFMAVSAATFGAYFVLKENEGEFTWLAFTSVMVYIAAFSLGIGAVPWVFASETIPVRAKGKCGGSLSAFSSISAFVITSVFYDLQNAITTQGTFWLFSGCCIVIVLFTIFLLPETKGKSLEEIERSYERKNAPHPNKINL
uniref:Solute carrier family 2, facilitated glucose transporter member 8 n=1 Tax=Phallusia mammillata TaxID=59560 RepID=A0A6F9DRY9_9ASCI|nr:solute carrier family 2, facilitated glucose transporter member 8-like [Phallusia mammillata]